MRSLWLRVWGRGLFGAGYRWFCFLYVSEGKHRAEQRPQFTLQDKSTASVIVVQMSFYLFEFILAGCMETLLHLLHSPPTHHVPGVLLKDAAAGASWHDFAYSSRRSLELRRLSRQSARCLEEERARERSERQFLCLGSRWRPISK